MDQTTVNPKEAKGKKYTHSVIRVGRDIGKRFFTILDQVNKKDFGGRVTATALLERVLTKVTPEDMQELQEGSLSNADRFDRQYARYQTEHGKIDRDAFLGLLMSGKLGVLPTT